MINFPIHKILLVLLVFVSIPIQAQEFGIQLYSLRNQFKTNVEQCLKTISDWGITTIEAGDTYGMEEEKFRGLLKKYNLNPISIGASYEDLRDNPAAVAEKAKRYGARFVMCSWIPHQKEKFSIIGHHSHSHEYLIQESKANFIHDIEKSNSIFKKT